MRPMQMQKFRNDEGKLIQTKYWMDIGGYGISPEHLFLVGFWGKNIEERFKEANVDTSQTIEQIYGGVLRFKPLPGKKFEERLDKVMDGLNAILQVERHVERVISDIKTLLGEEWHNDDDRYLPDELSEEIRQIIKEGNEKKKFVISEDYNTARQLLSMIPILKGLSKVPYTSGIFREAKTLFERMVLQSVSMSMSNLAINRTSEKDYYDLEEVANTLTESVMEGDYGK